MRFDTRAWSAGAVALALLSSCGTSHSTTADAHDDGASADGSIDAVLDSTVVPTTDAATADVGAEGDVDATTDVATSTDAGGSPLCHGAPTPFPCMPNSVFYAALPAAPKLATNSAAIFAYYSATWSLDEDSASIWNKGVHLVPDPESEADGNQAAIYFARESDPVLTVQCFEAWCAGGGEVIDGVQLHVPSGAKWQNYPDCADAGANDKARGACGDDHFEIVSPDGTTEYDLYEAFGCLQNGSTCLIGAGQFVRYATSNGFATNGVANATGWVPTQGLVLPSEILSGTIPHALALMFPCHDGKWVAPAEEGDGPGAACPDTTNVLTEGQRVFLAATDAQIESWTSVGVTVPGQIVLKALAHYGGYYADNQGYGGMTFWTINSFSYAAPGTLIDQWPDVASKYGLPRTSEGGSYDLGIEHVPGGISTWLRACDKGGC